MLQLNNLLDIYIFIDTIFLLKLMIQYNMILFNDAVYLILIKPNDNIASNLQKLTLSHFLLQILHQLDCQETGPVLFLR